MLNRNNNLIIFSNSFYQKTKKKKFLKIYLKNPEIFLSFQFFYSKIFYFI